MKVLTILILSLVSLAVYSQDANTLFKAIGNSDANAFQAVFTNDVEICIGVNQDFYSKKEAVNKLSAFLKEIQPKSCTSLHKGNSKDNSSKYTVGSLNSAKGKYRVFIYYEGNKVAGLMFNPE